MLRVRPMTLGSAEAALPVPVAQDRRQLGGGPVIIRRERAAQRGVHPKHFEEVARHAGRPHLLRLADAGDAGGERDDDADPVEAAVQLLDLPKLRARHPILRKYVPEIRPDQRQAIGFLVGQRPQKDRVHHAEDGGVGADSQRQGEHGDGSERRAFRQRAKTVTQVLQDGLEHGSTSWLGWRRSSTSLAKPLREWRTQSFGWCVGAWGWNAGTVHRIGQDYEYE